MSVFKSVVHVFPLSAYCLFMSVLKSVVCVFPLHVSVLSSFLSECVDIAAGAKKYM